MRTVGVDPGMSGAIAVVSPLGELLNVFDMPVFAVTKRVSGKDRKRNHINVHDLGHILAPYAFERVVIEHVGPQPSDGAMQAFQFGFGTGALHGVAGAHSMQIETVTPQKWKKHFGISADKNEARQLATRRWPQSAELFKRVKDAGRAEAALIALYVIETSARVAA
jgi:hypothetical protein